MKALQCFINRDESLSSIAILSCLKYWPLVNPNNEVASLTEIESILSLLKSTQHIQEVRYCLVQRVSLCCCSFNCMVAERALYLVHNPVFIGLLKEFKHELLPTLLDGIVQNILNEDRLF